MHDKGKDKTACHHEKKLMRDPRTARSLYTTPEDQKARLHWVDHDAPATA